MPGNAPSPLRRRGSDKYFISPANPRASHSSVCSNSGNFHADTTPQRSKPSSLARDSIQTVSDQVPINPILPYLCPSGERRASARPTGNQPKCRAKRIIGRLSVAAQSRGLVGIDFKDREKLCELQEIVHFFRQLQQL